MKKNLTQNSGKLNNRLRIITNSKRSIKLPYVYKLFHKGKKYLFEISCLGTLKKKLATLLSLQVI